MISPPASSADPQDSVGRPLAASDSLIACGRAWLRNIVIAAILLFMLLQAVPAVPGRVTGWIQPPARCVGIEQDQWRMFAPEADRRNHRIAALVFYSDGSNREWRPPAWREQSRWERFLTHRLSKFCENIYDPGFVAARPATADWIVGELARSADAPKAAAERVEFWVEEGFIPDANYHPWPSVAEPTKFETRWQFDDISLLPNEAATNSEGQP